MAYTAAYGPTLRQVKGSELTWAENDDNWTSLVSELGNIQLEFSSIDGTLSSLGVRVSSLETNQVIIPDGTINNQQLVWNAGTSTWLAQTIVSSGGGGVVISDTAPTTPADGDLWYDSLTAFRTYAWSSVAGAWLDTAPAGSSLPNGTADTDVLLWSTGTSSWYAANIIDLGTF